MTTTAQLMTSRYRLLGPLGEGAMGTVFRAHDRLTRTDVALKRVVLGADDADELRLALAHEFRMLAECATPTSSACSTTASTPSAGHTSPWSCCMTRAPSSTPGAAWRAISRLTCCSRIVENQGALARELGDYPAAQALLDQALQSVRGLQLSGEQAVVLNRLSQLALAQLESALAEQHARAALKIAQDLGLALEQQMAWNALGRAQLQQGDAEAAAQSFQAVLATPTHQQIPVELVSAQVGMVHMHMARGQISQARPYTEQVLAWLGDQQGVGLADLSGAYLTLYQVLAALGDPRAADMLATGYQDVQRRAATIGDPARRQRYMEQVRANRELLAAWDSANAAALSPL